QRVLQGGQRHDGGAVLVVVEHGDVEQLLQPLLELEALRGGDVLAVDAAEGGGDAADGLDDLVGRGHVDAHREAVDPGEVLEQQRLALHHRQGGLGPDVAQAQHRSAVADDGDRVLLDGEVVDPVRLGGNGIAHAGHARRVGHGQVVAVGHRHAGQHLDLAAVVHEERAVEALEHLAPLQPVGGGPHLLDVVGAAAVDDEVFFQDRTAYVEAADGGDVAPGVAYGGSEAAERAGTVVETDPKADRIGSGRKSH